MHTVRPLLLVLLLSVPAVLAQAQPMEGGARAGALAGSATALPGDLWGYANPASRATIEGASVGLFASQGYGLSELRLGAMMAVLPTRLGAWSIGGQTFGFDSYRRSHFSFGFARGIPLGPVRRLYLGVDARYYHVAIPAYGSAGAVGISIGWLADVAPGLYAGFQAVNLNGPRFTSHDRLERSLSVGVGYRPHASFHMLADVVKDIRFPASFRTGIEAYLVPALALRAGIATAPTRFSVGAGLHVSGLTADLVAERHEVLGWTPGLSVAISM